MNILISLFKSLGFIVEDVDVLNDNVCFELNTGLDLRTNADIFVYFLERVEKEHLRLFGDMSLNRTYIKYVIPTEIVEADVETLKKLGGETEWHT